MTDEKKKEQVLTEVWGDTVNLKELLISVLMGIVFTMVFYLVGRNIFFGMESLDASLAKGYALFAGISGCLISAVISAKVFRPKRFIGELHEIGDVDEILAYAHMTVEEEAEALSNLNPEIIKEMEEFELYPLLALIPEGSPNYKPEYKIIAEERKVKLEQEV